MRSVSAESRPTTARQGPRYTGRWMDIRSAWSGRDDRAVVAEARRGDSVTVLAFKSAVEGVLPATVRDLVEHEYAALLDAHLLRRSRSAQPQVM